MAVDAFLKCDAWKGESKQKGHEDQIEISMWTWGGVQPVDLHGTGHAIGKVTFQPLVIFKHVDKASAKFLDSLAKGTHVPSATLSCLKATGKGTTEEYLTIKLSDIFVSSYELSAGASPDASGQVAVEGVGSREKVTIQFTKVTYDYKAQGSTGSLTGAGTFNYDRATGEVS